MKDYSREDDWVTYVPAFDNNREEKDPVTVEILPLTVRDSRRQTGGVVAKRVKGGGIKTNTSEISDRLFFSHVRNITNLTENGKSIITAEDLHGSHCIELYNEIEEAINNISILDEGDLKNFKSRSDGFLEKTHGTAMNVTRNDRETETATGIIGEKKESPL